MQDLESGVAAGGAERVRLELVPTQVQLLNLVQILALVQRRNVGQTVLTRIEHTESENKNKANKWALAKIHFKISENRLIFCSFFYFYRMILTTKISIIIILIIIIIVNMITIIAIIVIMMMMIIIIIIIIIMILIIIMMIIIIMIIIIIVIIIIIIITKMINNK